MAISYKDEQKAYRYLANARKVIWQGHTLNMGIRKFKHSMADKDLVRRYKEYAWGSIIVKGDDDDKRSTKRTATEE